MIAICALIVGIYLGYFFAFIDADAPGFPANIIVFLENSFIYFIGGLLIYVLGKTMDIYLRTGEILRSSFSIIISILAMWFIFLAVIHIFQYFFNITEEFNFPIVLLYIGLGGFIGFISIEVYYYIKKHFPEKRTTK